MTMTLAGRFNTPGFPDRDQFGQVLVIPRETRNLRPWRVESPLKTVIAMNGRHVRPAAHFVWFVGQ